MTEQKTVGGLPWGAGTIQMRGRSYWAVYFDADGARRQENTWMTDPDDAKAYLAARALAVARDRVRRLKAILDEFRRRKAGHAARPLGGR